MDDAHSLLSEKLRRAFWWQVRSGDVFGRLYELAERTHKRNAEPSSVDERNDFERRTPKVEMSAVSRIIRHWPLLSCLLPLEAQG